jgi:hypothetical protein
MNRALEIKEHCSGPCARICPAALAGNRRNKVSDRADDWTCIGVDGVGIGSSAAHNPK